MGRLCRIRFGGVRFGSQAEFVDFQWVPAHIGIEGNEEANSLANYMRSESTTAMQLRHEIAPASLKPFLHQHERQKFHFQAIFDRNRHTGYRMLTAGIRKFP